MLQPPPKAASPDEESGQNAGVSQVSPRSGSESDSGSSGSSAESEKKP